LFFFPSLFWPVLLLLIRLFLPFLVPFLMVRLRVSNISNSYVREEFVDILRQSDPHLEPGECVSGREAWSITFKTTEEAASRFFQILHERIVSELILKVERIPDLSDSSHISRPLSPSPLGRSLTLNMSTNNNNANSSTSPLSSPRILLSSSSSISPPNTDVHPSNRDHELEKLRLEHSLALLQLQAASQKQAEELFLQAERQKYNNQSALQKLKGAEAELARVQQVLADQKKDEIAYLTRKSVAGMKGEVYLQAKSITTSAISQVNGLLESLPARLSELETQLETKPVKELADSYLPILEKCEKELGQMESQHDAQNSRAKQRSSRADDLEAQLKEIEKAITKFPSAKFNFQKLTAEAEKLQLLLSPELTKITEDDCEFSQRFTEIEEKLDSLELIFQEIPIEEEEKTNHTSWFAF